MRKPLAPPCFWLGSTVPLRSPITRWLSTMMSARVICTGSASVSSCREMEYGIWRSSDCMMFAESCANCMIRKTSRIVIMSIIG